MTAGRKMARSRHPRRISMKLRSLFLCTSLYMALGCSTNEPASSLGAPTANRSGASSPGFPASPIQVTTSATYAYPLKISTNRRYLVDQNNKPFRIQGDSAQSLIANLTYAEADKCLSDRQKKGFNTVNINLLEAKFAIHAPANRNGDAPFTKPGDLSTPNEAYFAFADSIIDLAASKGMLVSLAAMYLGVNGGDEGWWKVLTNDVNAQTVCYNFGLYIGKGTRAGRTFCGSSVGIICPQKDQKERRDFGDSWKASGMPGPSSCGLGIGEPLASRPTRKHSLLEWILMLSIPTVFQTTLARPTARREPHTLILPHVRLI